MKILAVQMNSTVGDLEGNCQKILDGIESARKKKVDFVLFPELALSGYPPEDFLLMPHFEAAMDSYLNRIIEASKEMVVIVGAPRENPRKREKALCNSAAVIHNQKLLGYQDKTLLPTYDIFDERRYFEPSVESKVWEIKGVKVGITICEDIWEHIKYHRDPVLDLKIGSPEILLNLSASPFRHSKFEERLAVCKTTVAKLNCPVILCNQIGGNDSLVFDGRSLYVGRNGELLAYAKGFEEDQLFVDLSNPPKPIKYIPDKMQELHDALVLGVHDYFMKLGFERACFGLSGGIDSAVVAAIAVEALRKENVLAVMMPSRFSTEESLIDAEELVKNLGIESRIVSIEQPFQGFLDILQPHFEGRPYDATEENLQARIRGMILMGISNKLGHIVLATGNKSELAMGYATLYGDMCGGLGVISDVTKREVYSLAKWMNRKREVIPENIITKEPSAELRPNQKDSDTLPGYEIIDNVLHDYVVEHRSAKLIAEKHNYHLDMVQNLIRKIHLNEYKRRQSPPGLRVSQKAFSVGRRFPIVQKWVP